MYRHKEQRHMPYGIEDVFDVIADVERYPEFLPWCSRLAVKSRTEVDGKTVILASLTGTFHVVSETFTSRVVLDRAAHAIDVAYIDGPFRHLVNTWRLSQKKDGGTTVDFYIEFDFKNPMLAMLISTVFQRVVAKMVNAFEARVRALHGSSRAPATS